MKNCKISIDLENPKHVEAALAFFSQLALGAEVLKGKPQKISDFPKTKEATEEKTKVATEEKTKAVPEVKTKVIQIEAGEITIDDLRTLFTEKQAEDKETNTKLAKDKLTELGAKNITSLSTDNYRNFYDFLGSL